jgi:hypothetical protein
MRQAILKAVVGSSANRERVLSRAGIIGVALFMGATTAHAQSTGIAACDDFLTKYDACVGSKIPAEQRVVYKTQLDQMRKAWLDMAKNPSAKATMEATCKQTMDASKTSLTAFGCSF